MPAALLTLFVLGFQAKTAKPISVSDLMKSVDKYDKKIVQVSGNIESFVEKTSKTSQKPYVLVVVKDAKNKVNIYMRGKAAKVFKKGEKVIVTGLYQKEHKVGKLTFKNEIDASNDKVKTNGIRSAK